VAALVRMAHELGLDVVAEGIEDEEQRDVLIALGCEAAQGYLWSPAVDPETFRKNVLAPIAEAQLAGAAVAGRQSW
jgi:EAL domain-containing protein (putative c-di-GMP-specific phosphodiesterase class I)